jgi:hypothetical protein
MSNLISFPHVAAAIGLFGPLALFSEVFAMALECATLDDLLRAVPARCARCSVK